MLYMHLYKLMSENNNLVYNLQLSGINCTNCEAKIKQKLTNQVKEGLIKVTVNVLQQKLNLIVRDQKALSQCLEVLRQTTYKVVGEPILIKGGDSSTRMVSFLYQITATSQQIQKIVQSLPGINSVSRVHTANKIKITVSYDSNVIKGRQIGDVIRQREPNYETINHRVQSFKTHKNSQNETQSITKTAIICTYFVVFNMFLPFTGEWYMQMSVYPSKLGPLTFYTLFNFLLSIYILYIYAKPFVVRSYKNYLQSGSMDMQTLISLGCLSAFFLFCFFFVRYSVQFINGEVITGHQIMEMNDAMASSVIIVLVVNIGKYFQRKVKNKIEQMTESIFPQSELFQNMVLTYVKLRNKKLTVLQKRQYDLTLIQKDDIIQIKQGRLLLDCIVLFGQFQAIKSAVDGNDQILVLKKGDRIQSGSIVLRCEQNSLLQVQNTFQKSVLIQIGTHIKIRQNQQQNSQSGIQAVCRSISRYFVKCVILLSIVVMTTWFFLLSFNYVKVPGCNFCWIVERGIGVLVASCPCALGLAVPSVVAIVLNIAIKNGILIRNSGVLEKMKKCKIICFDKTGTLFTRINKIQQYYVFNKEIKEKILWEIIAITEKQLRHPIAEILYKQAYQKCQVQGNNFNVILNKPSQIKKQGLQAQVMIKKQDENYRVLLGNKNILIDHGIRVPHFQKSGIGATVLYLALNQTPFMAIVINTHSNLRPEAQRVIQLLMKKKKEVHILSGDSKQSVDKLGQLLNIPHRFLHPQHSAFMKEQWIRTTQANLQESDGIGVIMVGDGLNDIPCLQQASIGVSINAKSELNINASDIILLSEDLYKIVAFVNLLTRGNQFININLFWAFVYNIVMMPIVAGLFYNFNITISPIWSSIAMSCSSIIVVGFSHILSFLTYDQDPQKDSIDLNKSKVQLKQTDSNSLCIGKQKKVQKYIKFNDEN